MQLRDFERCVVLAVDRRHPEFSGATADLLRGLGCEPSVFLNGRGGVGIPRAEYALVHEGEAPASWAHTRAGWDYWQAYRAVVGRALADGVASLLMVEDDIAVDRNLGAICRRAVVPADWGIVSFSNLPYFEPTPAIPVGPYVVRPSGGEGFHAIGWRPGAMRRLLEIDPVEPIDTAVGRHLLPLVPAYAIRPAVVRQRHGVVSSITPGEPFETDFLYEPRRSG